MYDQLYQALDQLVIKEDVNTNDKVEGDVTVIPTPEKEIPKSMIVLQQLKLVIQYLFKYLAGTLLISIFRNWNFRKRNNLKRRLGINSKLLLLYK